jgi:peptide/nickel transport system permease protein
MWLRFVIRRLAFICVSLLVVSALVFALMEVVPGDLAQTILGRGATPEQLQAVREDLGLDRPAPQRYLDWLGGALQGDFGESISLHADIGPLLRDRALNSLALAALAAVVGLSLAIALGFVAGLASRWADAVLSRVSVALGSLPDFLVAMLLILVFAEHLAWFPATSLSATGSPLDNPKGLVLPALTLVVLMVAYIMRITRASVAKVIDAEYVVAAEVRQISRRRIVRRHIAPNAILPTITVAANYVGWMVGGLIVIESVFAYPGLGLLVLNAARTRDVPLLESVVFLVAAARMLTNFAADALYMLIDPRVRLR